MRRSIVDLTKGWSGKKRKGLLLSCLALYFELWWALISVLAEGMAWS